MRSSSSDELILNAFILGAGRGPLVDVLFVVEKRIKSEFKIPNLSKWKIKKWAVEKNPGAFMTLKYKNKNKLKFIFVTAEIF